MIEYFFRQIILKFINFYQKYFSPDHGFLSFFHPWPGVCKFRPTCSEYAYQAIEKYGILKGGIKTIGRILRCHPLSKGGWDPLK
ncbi:MAG: membrane protein insertion efficiency factor YidD [Patescibacteria group bacterium]